MDGDQTEQPLSEKLAQDRTNLAVRRTIMAAQRSLMAWIRTSLSMIAFGFTIYAFLQSLGEKVSLLLVDNSARRIGLLLLGLGMIAILCGIVEYMTTFYAIKKISPTIIQRAPLIMATIIFLLGAFLFFNVLFRVGSG